MQRITPCLWFDTQAEEAARFYTSIVPRSRVHEITRYGDGMPLPKGSVMTVRFELDGQEFLAMNGGPGFPFTQAISLMVHCDSQAELDDTWRKLSDGGREIQCGWLSDRYGLSWQVVPKDLAAMLRSGNAAGIDRMMQALVGMVKLDIAALRRAFEG